jgi:hypothetical protein
MWLLTNEFLIVDHSTFHLFHYLEFCKKRKTWMAHPCNPSYFGGRNWEDHLSKKLVRPHFNKQAWLYTHAIPDLKVAEVVGSWSEASSRQK